MTPYAFTGFRSGFLSLCISLVPYCVAAQNWTPKGLAISGENLNDRAGAAVAMSANGQIIAVGAPQNEEAGAWAGQVRTFEWEEAKWIPRGQSIYGEKEGGRLGSSLALSADGQCLAVANNPVMHGGNPTVRVFTWNDSIWAPKGPAIIGPALTDALRLPVALSADGNSIVLGAHNKHGLYPESGSVSLFHWNGSSWSKTNTDLLAQQKLELLGWSVAISSDGLTVAAGAPLNDNDAGSNAGITRVHQWDGVQWMAKGSIPGIYAAAQEGYAVALSADGNTLATGAPFADVGAFSNGMVRIFDWDGASWIQRGQSLTGTQDGDKEGTALYLNPEGNVIIIGAPRSGTGYVRVLEWDGNQWVTKGASIPGTMPDTETGSAIAAAEDGQTLIFGEPSHPGFPPFTGQARAFTWENINANSPTEKTASFVLFPNPAKDFTCLGVLPDNSVVELLSPDGRVLQSHNNVPCMALNGYPAGLYTVRVYHPALRPACQPLFILP